ncbi:MAG: cytochrome c oxidase accessory protein CcoG [Pseudomonadota bacterium]|jgi:cytochrome c oxidase accessory protein FixG|nr:MAG: cytochrome c oxidase accessory protein CcoG [Pseudomonadota bacterium]
MNERATAATAESLYLPRQKVYPREVSGRFATLRAVAAWVLLGLFYLVPWLQWNGRQAVLFDLPARKFYVFGLVLWPQDFIFLTALLTIAALSLFFFTALAGRLWCGYACPQTVWTEVFLWLERFAEGDRNERMKLDRSPWTAHKIARKSLKQALWIAFALWTGFTFVGYFSPLSELLHRALDFSLGPWETFWTFFYGFATYGNAGYLREQVCKYMCPYARFQSAMFDRDTLIITYDARRGEPRGARRRGIDPRREGLGDCIDCTWCVQVCPTGIDIRKGLQIECIACAACIDACDAVMDRMGYPRGLIRYTTQNSLDGRPTRILRPRVLVYGTLLVVLITAVVAGLAMRTPLALDVIRDRNALYRVLDDGRVENVYNVKILNKTERPQTYVISVSGSVPLELDPEPARFSVASGEVFPAVLRVRAPRWEMPPVSDIRFEAVSVDDPSLRASVTARFIAPNEGGGS